MDVILLISFYLVAQRSAEPSWGDVTQDVARKRADLLKRLGEEKLWADPKNQKELLGCLKAARAMPDPKAVPVLLKHVMYSPYTEVPPLRPLEEMAPAFGALVSIGPAAIPEAIERLKKSDPEAEETIILVRLIARIYDQGGFGNALAIQRLELELSSTKSPTERANILEGVKWLSRRKDLKGKT